MIWYIVLLVTFSTFIVGVLYALYVKYLAENKMLKAAIYGELIVLFGAISTIEYVHNKWYLIPAIIGGFLGTLLTNKVKKLFKI